MSTLFERKRKFIIAFVALCMTFVLALLDVVDSGGWVGSVGLIVGLYATAEAAEGAIGSRRSP